MKNRMLLKNLSGLVLGEFYFIEPSKFQRRFFVRIIRVCVCVYTCGLVSCRKQCCGIEGILSLP